MIARSRGGSASWQRWAAGIVLVVAGAGATYAASEGFRDIVRDRVAGLTGGGVEERVLAPDVVPLESGGAGISVVPGERFTVAFDAAREGSVAQVALTNAPDLTVRALDAAPTFSAGTDRLAIDGAASAGGFDIDVPRGAAWVEILVGGRQVFLKSGSRIVTAAPEAGGRYRVELNPARE